MVTTVFCEGLWTRPEPELQDTSVMTGAHSVASLMESGTASGNVGITMLSRLGKMRLSITPN
eukprot:4777335-Pyramimonas_sp.AAC.1